MTSHSLPTNPIHLGLGATAVVEPAMTGDLSWYEGYGERHGTDGKEGRLVSMHTFKSSWDMWEMHPVGHEVVVCTRGSMTLHQEAPDGVVTCTTLHEGDYAINDPGIWHTVDIEGEATALFITAGEGTQHRPR